MILTSKKFTEAIAKISEEDKIEIIQEARVPSNLLLNSDVTNEDGFWTPIGETIEGLSKQVTPLTYLTFTQGIELSGTGTAATLYGYQQYFNAKVGEYYTASFYYCFESPLEDGKNEVVLEVGVDNVRIKQVDNEWHRVSITTMANHTLMSYSFGLIDIQYNEKILLTGFQVQQGKVLSEWELSQVDLVNKQTEIESNVGLLQQATTPERIIETVTLSDEYINAFNQKANVEDLEGFADGATMAESFSELNQYFTQMDTDLRNQLSELESTFTKSAKEIEANFSMSKGVNLIKNSSGFFDLEDWTQVSNYDVQTIGNEELEQKAIGSAFYSNHAFTLTQKIAVFPNKPYSFSFWQKKTNTGYSRIKLFSGDNEIAMYEIGYEDNVTGEFTSPFIVNFITESDQSVLRIVIENTEGTDSYYSGLMLNEGAIALQWSSHSDEVANTNIRFNLNGIYVKNKNDGSYTIMSSDEFAGYADVMDDEGNTTTERIFSLNGETTEIYALNTRKSITIGPAVFIPLSSTDKDGLALFI